MNLVIDDAAEVYLKDAKPQRELGMCSSVLGSYVTNQVKQDVYS